MAEVPVNVQTPEVYPKWIGTFDIPEPLARELSDLLTKQTIRERLLNQNLSDPVKFEQIESMLMPITAKIEAIKLKITEEHVPDCYRSSIYSWNYDGWEAAGTQVVVYQNMP